VTCCYTIDNYSFKVYLNEQDITSTVTPTTSSIHSDADMLNVSVMKTFTFPKPCHDSLLVFLAGDNNNASQPYSAEWSGLTMSCNSTDSASSWSLGAANTKVSSAWEIVQPLIGNTRLW